MEAAAAADRERHYDALSLLQRAVRTRLDNLAHEFMAEHVAGKNTGNDAVVKMQIAAADRGGGDLENGIARIDDLGIVDRIDAHVVSAVPG